MTDRAPQSSAAPPAAIDPSLDSSFFGHPRGLSTLFFTETWERFSYYGMQALLILFMTAAVADGGLGFDAGTAGAIYGLYTAGVYLLALPGGFLADRLLGQQRAVLYGGLLIAAGHGCLALGGQPIFFTGLVLIALGTGLLKPNISTIVGHLYTREDPRREAGFSIFYMGINLGGFAAPILCGYLGEKVDWHLGFGLAGIGMVLGVIQYQLGRRRLGDLGLRPEEAADSSARRRIAMGTVAGLLVLAAVGAALASGWLSVISLANSGVVLILFFATLFFVYLLGFAGLEKKDRQRVKAVAVFFVFSAIFWCGFQQGGSSMSLFARDLTDRVIGGWEFPASWFQFVNSAFVIVFVPIFALLWTRLGKRQPSVPVKFAMGLLFMGLGFAVLTRGAQIATVDSKASLGWLVAAFMLHTCGEMCLSPVGLAMATRLAPDGFTGQIMGVWFLSIALGNLSAGLVAGAAGTVSLAQVFGGVFIACLAASVVLLAFSRLVRRWME